MPSEITVGLELPNEVQWTSELPPLTAERVHVSFDGCSAIALATFLARMQPSMSSPRALSWTHELPRGGSFDYPLARNESNAPLAVSYRLSLTSWKKSFRPDPNRFPAVVSVNPWISIAEGQMRSAVQFRDFVDTPNPPLGEDKWTGKGTVVFGVNTYPVSHVVHNRIALPATISVETWSKKGFDGFQKVVTEGCEVTADGRIHGRTTMINETLRTFKPCVNVACRDVWDNPIMIDSASRNWEPGSRKVYESPWTLGAFESRNDTWWVQLASVENLGQVTIRHRIA